MLKEKFLSRLSKLGTYSCRRHRRKGKQAKQHSDASWHSRYGTCLDGEHHFCNFIIEPPTLYHLVLFSRRGEVNGQSVRLGSISHRPGRPRGVRGCHSAPKNQ